MDSIRLILHAPAPGAWNMAVDEALLETAARAGTATLRFYAWSEPTVSLGYFQRHDDRREHAASQECVAVRRTTGGGAIVHDRELTYSFTAPVANRFSDEAGRLYRIFHRTLADLLIEWGLPARVHAASPVGRTTDVVANRRSTCEPFLCFLRRTEGDLLVGSHKVAGSAQRRHRGAVLQHGSVLIQASPSAPELPGLSAWGTRAVDRQELAEAWCRFLERDLCASLERGRLSQSESSAATTIQRDRFGNDQWTRRR